MLVTEAEPAKGSTVETLTAVPGQALVTDAGVAWERLRVQRDAAWPVEASEQVRPHLVVLGNAAHSLHPIAGQGYNLSLRDTLALAEALLDSPATPGDFSVLQDYLQRQRLDQQMTVGFSDQVTRLFSTAQPLLVAGRNLGLLGLDLLPPAKHWFARQAMGLGTRPL